MSNDEHGERERTGVSRRAVLKTGAVTGAAAAGSIAVAGTAGAAAAAGGGPVAGGNRNTSPAGDLILYNGTIHAMDGSGTVASVIAIRGGFVAYVGDSLGAAQRQFTTWPRAIDLRGRMAVPGLIDCHNHVVLMGNRPGHHTPLENAYSIADVQAIYAARAATLPPSPDPPVSADDFITTIGGFSPNQFKETRLPTLAELDAAVPDHPVYISVGFTGPSVTNTLGKAFFENVAPPVGPVPVGADGSIAPSGFTTPGPTGQATLALRHTLTFDARKRSVRDAMTYAVSGHSRHATGALAAAGSCRRGQLGAATRASPGIRPRWRCASTGTESNTLARSWTPCRAGSGWPSSGARR